MKLRYFALTIALTAALVISGCGKDNKKDKNTDKKSPKKTETTKDDESDGNTTTEATGVDEITGAGDTSDLYGDVLSDDEVIECGRKITADITWYEYYLLIDAFDEYDFDEYEKALLSAYGSYKTARSEEMDEDFIMYYDITPEDYQDSVNRHLGCNIFTAPLSFEPESFYYVCLYSTDDGLCLANYEGETDMDMQLNAEGAASIDVNGTTMYTYTKTYFFDHWSLDHNESNCSITYTLSRDSNSEYGVLIEDIDVEYFEYLDDIDPGMAVDDYLEDNINKTETSLMKGYPDGFYGIFIGAFKDSDSAVKLVEEANAASLNAFVIYTPHFENLNPEPYYAVITDAYATENQAKSGLDIIKKHFPDAGKLLSGAYVKFSGKYRQ